MTTSEEHPGERHVYTLPIDGGPRTKITSMAGSNQAEVSPDESTLGLVFSYSNKPPEVYLMPNAAGASATQITTTPTEGWRSFKWIDPKVFTFKARDGVDIPARLFTPEMIGARRDPTRPGVVFVHGAGYLQNAHKYWSAYSREFMFHNLLASRGYVVLDVDYRASSGYGRDWRTAIYRHMGGKDLEDVVDGAKYLSAVEKVDPRRIGVYGGSYGGFITLMAMFTTPDVFAAGAALRPVTDWAHYNHGYTSNILNNPQKDAEAYRKSSPIYFAEGLKGSLLICHGMVDTNVHFQDSVRLTQRLIELRKETGSSPCTRWKTTVSSKRRAGLTSTGASSSFSTTTSGAAGKRPAEWTRIPCSICSGSPVRCSRGTSGYRQVCTAIAIFRARWCSSFRSSPKRSVLPWPIARGICSRRWSSRRRSAVSSSARKWDGRSGCGRSSRSGRRGRWCSGVDSRSTPRTVCSWSKT